MSYLGEVVNLQYEEAGKNESLRLSVYSPVSEINTQAAVVICPGGGYYKLATEHEGLQFASWLQSHGITGIVLPYKLPAGDKNKPIASLKETFRYLHTHSEQYDIDVNKIGLAGFSAGGHLSAIYSNLDLSCDVFRPAFTILFYPVISLTHYRHLDTFHNFLGKYPSEKDIQNFSSENKVTERTPPTLLFANSDDKQVPSQNSILYYEALRNHNIPAALYIFPEGGHGWGMRKSFRYHSVVLDLLLQWLFQFI